MRDTIKIGIACFTGAFIGTAAAVILALEWWMGLVAGAAAGYIAYEFRSILQAIPKAWKAVSESEPVVGPFIASLFRGLVIGLKAVALFVWRGPFILPVIPLGVYMWMETKPESPAPLIASFAALIFFTAIPWMVWFILVILSMAISGYLGKKLSSGWLSRIEKHIAGSPSMCGSFRSLGIIPIAAVLIPLGLVCCIWFVIVAVPRPVGFAWRFLHKLFTMIHSDKRILCALDSALGVAITLVWIASPEMTATQKVATVIFGGLIGAGIGIASWEIISKRILHLDRPKTVDV